MSDYLTALRERFPKERETIRAINEFQRWADAQPHEPFREPKSPIIHRNGKPEVRSVDVVDLNAWRCHVANGTLVRLRALETTILSELVAGRATASLIVARAHMEVAGLAAYCSDVLSCAGREGRWDRLAKVVQQVFFGSSMRIQSKGTPALESFLIEEVCPIRPGEFIKAMDRFAGHGGTRYQMIYGLLSDYAHPVTSRAFFDVQSEDETGWLLKYRGEDPLDDVSAHMALDILSGNMRIAYACAALIARSAVIVRPDGAFELRTPTEEQAGEIWLRFLDLTSGNAAAG